MDTPKVPLRSSSLGQVCREDAGARAAAILEKWKTSNQHVINELKRTEDDIAEGLKLASGLKKDGLDLDALEAFKCLACRYNDPVAQNEIGLMLFYGSENITEDVNEAAYWFQKSADQEYPPAQYHLGMMYRNQLSVSQGNVEIEEDFREVFNWIKIEAFNWIKKSADLGHPPAQNSLGVMFRDGWCVPQDNVEAFNWFQKSAGQGYPLAQCNLGMMYRDGRGVCQNLIDAFKWIHKSAEKDPWGQFILGKMYSCDLWGRENPELALRYYRLASDNGSGEASHYLTLHHQHLYIQMKSDHDFQEIQRYSRLSMQQGFTADMWVKTKGVEEE